MDPFVIKARQNKKLPISIQVVNTRNYYNYIDDNIEVARPLPENELSTFPPADVIEDMTAEYIDNVPREKQLELIYEDTKIEGWIPMNDKDINYMLNKYSELDINIKDKYSYSLLDTAGVKQYTEIAQRLINNPRITTKTLEDGLNKIIDYGKYTKLTKTHKMIIKAIEDKLKFLKEKSPSAPPLEEKFNNLTISEPSAPLLELPDVPNHTPLPSSPPISKMRTRSQRLI